MMQSTGPVLSSSPQSPEQPAATSVMIKKERNVLFIRAPYAPLHFRYDEKNKQFAILIIQLSNLSALLLQQDQKV